MADEPFEEASLDDFFQPPADEEQAPSPATAPVPPAMDFGDPEAAADAGDSFEAALGDPFAGEAGAPPAGSTSGFGATPQVEDLPIGDLGGGRDWKKVGILAGGGVAALLVIGVLLTVFFGGEEAAAPSPSKAIKEEPLAASEPPELPSTPPPAPPLNVERLGDLSRRPSATHVEASTLYSTTTQAVSEDGSAQMAELGSPLTFYIGAFVVPKNLEAAKQKLRDAGLTPKVRESRQSVQMNRLHVGNYDNLKAARGVQAKLKRAGFDAFVLKAGRGNYEVYAGSFYTDTKAREYQKRLYDSNSGFVGEITTTRVEMPVYELWAGSYPTAAEAQTPVASLLRQGVEFDVVVAR